jgi:hypothetical protein
MAAVSVGVYVLVAVGGRVGGGVGIDVSVSVGVGVASWGGGVRVRLGVADGVREAGVVWAGGGMGVIEGVGWRGPSLVQAAVSSRSRSAARSGRGNGSFFTGYPPGLYGIPNMKKLQGIRR